MIDGLKSYPAMKNSGVPCLGDMPEHWEVLPNRALFVEVKERDHPDEQMLSVTITKGLIRQHTQAAIYLSKVMSGRTGKEMGRYFGIKGPAVSEVIKGIEGWWDEEKQPRKEIEFLREERIIEF